MTTTTGVALAPVVDALVGVPLVGRSVQALQDAISVVAPHVDRLEGWVQVLRRRELPGHGAHSPQPSHVLPADRAAGGQAEFPCPQAHLTLDNCPLFELEFES